MPPAYFYHLAFELYPASGTKADNLPEVYIPPAGTDIFTSEFPVHRSSPWAITASKRPAHRRTRTEASASSSPSKLRTFSFQRSSEDHKPRLGLTTAFSK